MVQIKKKDLKLYVGFREQFCDDRFRVAAKIVRVEDGDGSAFISVRTPEDGPITEFTIARADAERFAQAILLMSGAAEIIE